MKDDLAKRIARHRDDLETFALQYARLATLGRYLDVEGCWAIPCGSDVNDYIDHYRKGMEMAAKSLLAELSRTPLPPRA